MLKRRDFMVAAVLAGGGLASGFSARISGAAEPARAAAANKLNDDSQKKYDQAVAKAISYLTSKARAADGSYNAPAGPGITALVVTGMLRHGVSPDDPRIAKSLKYLESFVQPDGGVYGKDSFYKNYETCLSILCFTAANEGGRYDKLLKTANAFIKDTQWDESEQKPRDDTFYGGAGYGRSKRPDLSNTTFLVDALKANTTEDNKDAIAKALVFVSRCQNLETEHNTTPFAAKNPDGGFYYTPAGGGNSQAGTDEKTGGLRSYASMTYAGLKSKIYAGVKSDDPRVKAAATWARKHYSLKENPGMGAAGLYYYYHTFAKALSALGEDQFADEAGVQHDWRAELIAELAARQREDGAWVNENAKWLEGDASMCTGFALLALSYCGK